MKNYAFTEFETLFPKVEGINLLRQKVVFPIAFRANFNVIFIALQQWQQARIDTWIPYVQDLESTIDSLQYHELPVIKSMNIFARTLINEGTRAGISNQLARERTVTLYLDKEKFRQSLAIPNENDIHILLLDRYGKVL